MFARTLRTTFAAALLALSVVPAAAFASPADSGAKETIRQEKKEKESFPIPAAEFKTKVATHLQKAREHMVTKMTERKVPADKQKERLAKFDAGSTTVMTKVNEVCSDGTVTKDEAREVHKLARELRGHKKHEGKKGTPTGKRGEKRDRDGDRDDR